MTKLLVVSPDYASHALPLLQVARAWNGTQGDVVFATGRATRPLVEHAAIAWTELRLGKGSNGGVIDPAEQPAGEDDHLREFFRATREGPLATLRYQADARRHDLMFDPDGVLDRLRHIVDSERPDRVLVDHVAFGARLALHALGVTPATLVLGHPSALAAAGEVYGLPPEWPLALRPTDLQLARLRACCLRATSELAAAAQDFLRRRAPKARPPADLTSLPGSPTIYVYPECLHDPARQLPQSHVFVGELTREEDLGDVRLPTGTGPRVTVALGSFLSARADVLAVAARAACQGRWRLALAHGSSPVAEIGPVPAGALVARHLPQVALLPHTDVLITHGGNGSVTEAVAASVPMVVLPFSTDQFAGAAAVERTGFGLVLSPNSLTSEALVDAVGRLQEGRAAEWMANARAPRETTGAARAVEAIVAQRRRPAPPVAKSVPHARLSSRGGG